MSSTKPFCSRRLLLGQLLPCLLWILTRYLAAQLMPEEKNTTESVYWVDCIVHQPNFESQFHTPWPYINEEHFERSFLKYKESAGILRTETQVDRLRIHMTRDQIARALEPNRKVSSERPKFELVPPTLEAVSTCIMDWTSTEESPIARHVFRSLLRRIGHNPEEAKLVHLTPSNIWSVCILSLFDWGAGYSQWKRSILSLRLWCAHAAAALKDRESFTHHPKPPIRRAQQQCFLMRSWKPFSAVNSIRTAASHRHRLLPVYMHWESPLKQSN